MAEQSSHPPTYEDFVRREAKGDNSPPDGFRLSEADISTILERGEVSELAGACASDFNYGSESCLWLALELRPDESRLWALASYRLFRRLRDAPTPDFQPKEVPKGGLELIELMASGTNDPRVYLGCLSHWGDLDPDNVVPVCLRAAHFASVGDLEEMKRCLQQLTERSRYNNYGREIRWDIVRAAESAGYPAFTARVLALGWLHPFTEVVPLGEALKRLSDEKRRTCIASRVEESATLFSEKLMVGLFREAGKHPDSDLLEYIQTFAWKDLPEQRWLAYYDQVLEEGEAEAVRGIFGEREGEPGSRAKAAK